MREALLQLKNRASKAQKSLPQLFKRACFARGETTIKQGKQCLFPPFSLLSSFPFCSRLPLFFACLLSFFSSTTIFSPLYFRLGQQNEFFSLLRQRRLPLSLVDWLFGLCSSSCCRGREEENSDAASGRRGCRGRRRLHLRRRQSHHPLARAADPGRGFYEFVTTQISS